MKTQKKQTTENFIKEIRRKTKRIFSSEQKIQIVNSTEIRKGQIINLTANSFEMEVINESEGDEEKVIVYFERYIK